MELNELNMRRLLFMSTTLFLAQGVFASEYIPCDGCSMSQMEYAARVSGIGRYVVGDINGNKVVALRVQSGNDPGGPRPLNMDPYNLKAVVRDYLTAEETEAFNYYRQFYYASPVGYKKHFNLIIVPPGTPLTVPASAANNMVGNTVSSNGVITIAQLSGLLPLGSPAPGGGEVSYPNPGVNAYTVVNGGPTQNAFLFWLGGLTAYGIRDQSLAAVKALSIFHIADSSVLPGLTFTVRFTDGSHIGVYIDTTEHPPQLEVDSKTAVDSHGNNIPAAAKDVAGKGQQEYDFSRSGNGGDEGNMRSQIGGFGINPPATHRYKCVSYPGGSGGVTIQCVPY